MKVQETFELNECASYSGLCRHAIVQISHAIGVAKPLSLFYEETSSTEQGALTVDDVTNVATRNIPLPSILTFKGWNDYECQGVRSSEMFTSAVLNLIPFGHHMHMYTSHVCFIIYTYTHVFT